MDDKALAQMIAALATEEDSLLARLTKVRAARATLEALQTDEPVEFDGKLADACRAILKTGHTKSWSPVEIRDQLKVIGYTKKHENLMAAIHGVLKRIVDSGDAKTKEAKDGSGARYSWAGPTEPVPSPRGMATVSGPILFDTSAIASALDAGASMKSLIDSLNASPIDIDGIFGRNRMTELAEKIAESTKGLRNLESGFIKKL